MSRRHAYLTPDAIRRLTTDTEPYMSCEECFDQIDRYIDTVLGGGDRISQQMRAHLTACGACFEEAWSLLLLSAAEQQVNPRQALARMRGDVDDDHLPWPDAPIDGEQQRPRPAHA